MSSVNRPATPESLLLRLRRHGPEPVPSLITDAVTPTPALLIVDTTVSSVSAA